MIFARRRKRLLRPMDHKNIFRYKIYTYDDKDPGGLGLLPCTTFKLIFQVHDFHSFCCRDSDGSAPTLHVPLEGSSLRAEFYVRCNNPGDPKVWSRVRHKLLGWRVIEEYKINVLDRVMDNLRSLKFDNEYSPDSSRLTLGHALDKYRINIFDCIISRLRSFKLGSGDYLPDSSRLIALHIDITRLVASWSNLDECSGGLDSTTSGFMIALDRMKEEVCPVCLEGLAGDEEAMLLPCSHIFHHVCLGKWNLRKQTCPSCRCTLSLQKF